MARFAHNNGSLESSDVRPVENETGLPAKLARSRTLS